MKNLRKLFMVFLGCLLTVSFVFPLSGCHTSSGLSEFSIPDEFDASRNYTVTFWAKNDTNKKQTQIYQKAIDDFEKLYPNITIKMKLYTDYGKIYNDVINNISTNTTPDIAITYPDHIATYITGTNTVVPLDDLMNDSKYGLGGSEVKFDSPTSDEIISKYLDEGKLNNHYYALPFMRSTEVCYINVSYLKQLGYEIPDILTWDFVYEVSEKALEKNADGTYKLNGQNVLIPFIYKSTDNMLIQILKQMNAGYSDDDGSIDLFNGTTEEVLKTVSSHAATGAFSTFKISGYPANFLNAGQCIFAVDSTAGSTWMGSNAPLSDISADKQMNFDTAVRVIPQYDTENPEMISQGPSICLFNKSDSQQVMASWLFEQYLLTDEVQIPYSETEGYIPVTAKAQNSAAYKEYLSEEGTDNDAHYQVKIEAVKTLLKNIDNTFITSVFNGSASLRDAAGTMIETVCKDVKRGKTIDDAYFDNLYDSVNSMYKLDQIERKNMQTSDHSKDLGEMPLPSKILLGSLALCWIGILIWWICGKARRRTEN